MKFNYNDYEYEELKRLRRLSQIDREFAKQAEESALKLGDQPIKITHDRRPARKVNNHRWRIHNDYYGLPWYGGMW